MVLLIGIPSEAPMRMAIEALERRGIRFVLFNQRLFDSCDVVLETRGAELRGHIHLDGRNYPLEAFTGVYARPMDDTQLPELAGEPGGSPRHRHCRLLHELLMHWMDIAAGRVVNRPSAMGSNISKPYQAQLIRDAGFAIPRTIVSDDPDEVRAFAAACGRVIYKSISGARSIVTELKDEDFGRLHAIESCPTQFQELVRGFNVRVHTLGDRVFAAGAETTSIDYRYAGRQGGNTELRPMELPPPWAERSVELARKLGLDFAGIDLMFADDDRTICFEVNPCPAYSYYEVHTGQPIAAALAEYLGSAAG